jgi:hypothetical protein
MREDLDDATLAAQIKELLDEMYAVGYPFQLRVNLGDNEVLMEMFCSDQPQQMALEEILFAIEEDRLDDAMVQELQEKNAANNASSADEEIGE